MLINTRFRLKFAWHVVALTCQPAGRVTNAMGYNYFLPSWLRDIRNVNDLVYYNSDKLCLLLDMRIYILMLTATIVAFWRSVGLSRKLTVAVVLTGLRVVALVECSVAVV